MSGALQGRDVKNNPETADQAQGTYLTGWLIYAWDTSTDWKSASDRF